MDLLIFLVIGAIAGWLAGLVMKGRGLGLVGNLVVGIVGSFLGGWVLGLLGISLGSPFVTAFIGAVLLLAIVGAIKKA